MATTTSTAVAAPGNSNIKDGEPILNSVRYYGDLRRSNRTTHVREGNLDLLLTEEGETIPLVHLFTIMPFTTGDDYVPHKVTFEDAASILLAAEHLNTGYGGIVPEIADLHERCPVRFTTEFADTRYRPGSALHEIVQAVHRPYPQQVPTAFIGAYRSAVSMPTSIVTGIFGYPQISPGSSSVDLDDKSQYPLFGRTNPSDQGNTIPIVIYLYKVLKIKHLAVINVNDAYGNAYVEGMRMAAAVHAPDMILTQIPLDEGDEAIQQAVQTIQSTEFRFVYGVLFTRETHDALMTEAYNQGVAGTGVHNWLFADTFLGVLNERTVPTEPEALRKAYEGVGLLEVSGGVPGIPSYDNYVNHMTQLKKHPADLQTMEDLMPKHPDHPAFDVPSVIRPDHFLEPLINGLAPFAYEASVALGLAACDIYDPEVEFTGPEHYEAFKRTTFTGVSGRVVLNNVTGSREPESALLKVSNWLQAAPEVDPDTGDEVVRFVPTVTDIFHGGEWVEQTDFVFNDGTTNLPADLPPASEEEGVNLGLAVGLPVALAILVGLAVYLFYENKRKQNDSVWLVAKDELIFTENPEILGRGTFGLVLLAEYRGTQVAVKRVIPPNSSGKSDGRLDSFQRAPGSCKSVSGDESSDFGVGSNNGTAATASMVGLRSGGGTGANSSLLNSGSGGAFASLSAPKRPEKNENAMWRKMKHDFVEEMRYVSKLRHPCVTTIMGAVLGKDPLLIMEYMEHGSLYDILHNDTMVIEGELLLPILRDISQGVRFLHSATPQVIHGDLKAQNILVDSKFRAKVADFGLSQKSALGGTGTPFWMAPELLRRQSANTAATDAYSFGIILYEVYSRRDPYEDEEDAFEVLKLVSDPEVQKRPPFPKDMPNEVKVLMRDCLQDDPGKRPSFEELDTRMKRMDTEGAEPTHATAAFKPKSKGGGATVSLFDIFPHHIAEALRDGRPVEAEHKECVTIFFSDIVGFTTISSELTPQKVASMLDRLYTKFDKLSELHDVFKVETIGDAYMAVSNLVKDQKGDHCKRIAEFATAAITAANQCLIDVENPARGCVNIRVGFHSGPVVADVVGTRNPRYCLFGDTVNTASRMESNSEVNRIHCSKPAAKILNQQCPNMPLDSRGKIPIKGKGHMVTFWVNEHQPKGKLQQQNKELWAETTPPPSPLNNKNKKGKSPAAAAKVREVPEMAPPLPPPPPVALSPPSAITIGREEGGNCDRNDDRDYHHETRQLQQKLSERLGYSNNPAHHSENGEFTA